MLASVGVSISHDPDADPEAMLREADVAMYRAKGAGGRRLELFDEDLRREVERAPGDRGPPAPRAAPARAAARLPADPAARRRAGRSAARRSCAGARTAREHSTSAELLPATFLPPRRGERADRADRRLGAAHRLRAGGRLAAQRDRDPGLGQRLRARADRARSRRAGARGARLLPAARARAVPGGERGGRPARSRARALGAEGRQAPRRVDRARQLRLAASRRSACRGTCRSTCSSSTAR